MRSFSRAAVCGALVLASSSGFADSKPDFFTKGMSAVKKVWAPLPDDSDQTQFAKTQIINTLWARSIELTNFQITVKPDVVSMPLNGITSVVNVEHDYFPNLKDYNVAFSGTDDHGRLVKGTSEIHQVNCQAEKTVVDCDKGLLEFDKGTLGVFGDEAHHNRIAMWLINDDLSIQAPKVLDFKLH